MKVLYISNIAPYEGITNFSIATQLACQQLGLEFHIAKNFSKTPINIRENCEKKYEIKLHHIDLKRNPFHPCNIKAIRQIYKLIKSEEIDIIHCNTPVGGVIGRVAGRLAEVKTIIYQSHGFHFYKRAPFLNWLLFYPAEKIMARWTDALLTINEEDYENAIKLKLRNNGKVYKTLGVGLDTKIFSECIVNRKTYREELNIPQNAILLLTVGEIASHKNQKIIIDAMKHIENKEVYLLICGEGTLKEELMTYVKELGLEERIRFLGRRNDIAELCNISDIFCFPSKREGMGIAPLEGMAAGLPLISSNIQGIKDYSKTGRTGFCLEYDDLDGFANAISKLASNSELRKKYGEFNKQFVKKYDRENCVKVYKEIYEKILCLGDDKK